MLLYGVNGKLPLSLNISDTYNGIRDAYIDDEIKNYFKDAETDDLRNNHLKLIEKETDTPEQSDSKEKKDHSKQSKPTQINDFNCKNLQKVAEILHKVLSEVPNTSTILKEDLGTTETKWWNYITEALRFAVINTTSSNKGMTADELEYLIRISENHLKTVPVKVKNKWERLQKNAENTAPAAEEKPAVHRALDLTGLWHTFHISDTDESYIRVGRMVITESGVSGEKLHGMGLNFNVKFYDENARKLNPDITKHTSFETFYKNWTLTPRLDGSHDLTFGGDVIAYRTFEGGKYIDQPYTDEARIVPAGKHPSQHEFNVVIQNMDEPITEIKGTFSDRAPGMKHGDLYLFRDEVKRNEKLLELRGKTIRRAPAEMYFYDHVIAQVKDAGKHAFNQALKSNVQTKGEADFVTGIDHAISNGLVRELRKLAPDIAFVSEESDSNGYTGKYWILDPIDGTTNLVYDYNFSSISLALVNEGLVEFGVIYNPFNGDLFTAERGKGAYLNGQKLDPAPDRALKNCLIEFGAGSTYKQQYTDEVFDMAKAVFTECLDIRRVCSSALAIAYVAAGKLNGYFEPVLKPWDYAAAVLMLEECGCKYSDWNGAPVPFNAPSSFVCGTPTAYNFLMQTIAEYHKK